MVGTLDYRRSGLRGRHQLTRMTVRLVTGETGKRFVFSYPNASTFRGESKRHRYTIRHTFKRERRAFACLLGWAGRSQRDYGFENFKWRGREITEEDLEWFNDLLA